MTSFFFDYDLPESLIAQQAVEPRDAARLLVLHRESAALSHAHVRDLPEFLAAGDRLILNDTKVIPARLCGRRCSTGGKWEALFLREQAGNLWELLAKTRGYPKIGEVFEVEPGPLQLTLQGRAAEKHWLMRPESAGTALELLSRHGRIPLPPYIRKGRAVLGDDERYQTVYAQRPGSIAAPTAGLHFTAELFDRLKDRSIETSWVTLHVGLGTFAPVKTVDPREHQMHSEWCEVSEATVTAIQATKAAGKRIIAVGTTTTRTLETAALSGELRPFRGESELYIYPPFEFRVLDGLLTNFHLPRTTLLLLVQAFAGIEALRLAYEEAIRQKYRFYSYGDAMLIL
jgi:S-adenosylmethionine:tRNA ribosyltransferase-isomerase